MKCLLKPTTPFMLMLEKGEVVEAHRPSVVSVSATVNARLASGQLRLIEANLPDTATDDDFRKFWRDADRDEDLAVSSFMSQFRPKVEAPTLETPGDQPPVAARRRK